MNVPVALLLLLLLLLSVSTGSDIDPQYSEVEITGAGMDCNPMWTVGKYLHGLKYPVRGTLTRYNVYVKRSRIIYYECYAGFKFQFYLQKCIPDEDYWIDECGPKIEY